MASGTRPRATRSYRANDPTNFVVEEWPESKRDLYEAARQLFWDKGFADASVQDIVERAKLTKGAFYHYFNAKEDILQIMYERSLVRLMHALERQRSQNLTVVESLHALIVEMVRVANEYSVEVTMFWEQYRRLPAALEKTNRDRRRDFYLAIAEMVESGIKSKELSASLKPQVFAMSVIGVCQHSQHWYLPGRGLSLDELAIAIADTFLQGAVRR
jgi:AcrR family transcriptional regulator